MPEFEKPYTYGSGHYSYIVKISNEGSVGVYHLATGTQVKTPEAVAYHLTVVKGLPGFRYI